MLNCCPDKNEYLVIFFRECLKLDTNLCQAVFANQPAFVSWMTSKECCEWFLCILPMEMPVPDDHPAEFVCARVPSTLIDVCARATLDSPMSDRDCMYSRGHYHGWHKLPVSPYPEELRSDICFWTQHPAQDFQPELLHYTHCAVIMGRLIGLQRAS